MKQPTTETPTTKSWRDLAGIAGFIIAIWLGAVLLNTFVLQTYTVQGPSMEPTLATGDVLFVNKLPVTAAHLRQQTFVPARGSLIVFANPLPALHRDEAYIVKRVVGLPGERVVVENGAVTVFNHDHPTGLQPDTAYAGPKSPTDGDVDVTVPDNELFVMGDNRTSSNSLDSRNGLSTVPLQLVQGQVGSRLFPFHKINSF